MGYIFETEIDQILNTVRGQTIGEDESITLRRILVSPVHPALKAYFRAEVEETLGRERQVEVRSKQFPYSHPEVLSLQQQIDLLLVYHYQFSQDEFGKVLDEAVHFQFNYLCRPKFTLLGYVVGDRRRVPVADVFKKLLRCVEYEYFPELIRRYCEERGMAEITYEEFRKLLTRIDTEVVSRHAADELAAMSRALISFVDFGRASPHDDQNQPTLPTNAAIVFYEDKGLEAVKNRLEQERDEHQRDRLTLTELKDILREVWSDRIDAPVRTVKGGGDESEENTETSVAQPALRNAEPPERNGSEGSSPVVVADPPLASPIDEGVDGVPVNVLPDVHDFFNKKDVKRFVRTIFAKDDKAFREALDAFNQFVAWGEASHYLDNVFVAQNIDPFSKEAVEFTDKIYTRFFPK